MTLRVAILGTGAMASLVGARLARAGSADVTLVGTWRAALAEIDAHGIVVLGDGPAWSAELRAVRLADADAPVDVVIVLVKSPRTADVAPHAARLAATDGIILTLQNGLGNLETLAEAAGGDRVTQGVTAMGATLLAPGRVAVGGGGLTAFGATEGTRGPLASLAAAFEAAAMPAEVREDIAPMVWRKLAVNCAINPLSALLRVTNGRLLARPAARAVMVAAAREVEAVAHARGVNLGADPAALALAIAERTAANRSSMLQDVERGVPTEVDAINGAVVDEGRRLGVPTPVNAALAWRVAEGLPFAEDAQGRHLAEILAGDGVPDVFRRPMHASLTDAPRPADLPRGSAAARAGTPGGAAR